MLRTDALATLYFFHPLRRLLPKRTELPILMYHSISHREERTHPYYQTVTSPEIFARQMRHLHENGCASVDLREAARYIESPCSTGSRQVAITFDDGFQDFYTHAFPILNKFGFQATMFLPTAYIGKTVQSFKGVKCMTWGQIRELRKAGVSFGSHTVTHPQLKLLGDKEVRHELQHSKDTIEQELGCAVTSFAYPYAFPEANRGFTNKLCGHLQESGYELGVSTIIGTVDRSGVKFLMPRLPVNSCDSPRMLQAKLDGGYNWLHTVQYFSKMKERVALRS